MSSFPSVDMYRVLKTMCELHGIPHHDLPRSTFHSWSVRGYIDDIYIESLSMRLVGGSALTFDSINDLALGLGYLFPSPLPC